MTDFGMIDERLREIQSMLTGPVSGEAPAEPGGVAVAAPQYEQPQYEPPRYEQSRYEQPRYEQPQYEQAVGAPEPPQPALSRFAAPIPPPAPPPPPIGFTTAPAAALPGPGEHGYTPTPSELSERAVIEPAEARARALIATAELEAARIVADSRAEVQDLARQIDELVILRDRLAQSVAEHQQMLAAPPAPPEAATAPGYPSGFAEAAGRLPQAPTTYGAPEQPRWQPAEPQAYPPAEQPPGIAAHVHTPGSWESSTPATPYAPAAVSHYATSPAAEPPYTPAPAAIVPGTFGSAAGVATLIIGHFEDVSSIERFEQQLLRLGHLDDVYLRAYDSGRAIFELTLPDPVALVSDIQGITPITVVNETPAALVASLASGGHPR